MTGGPKVAQLVSGKSGPELRSVSSGYVRGPGLCIRLPHPTKVPSRSPTQFLSLHPGLAWPDLGMPIQGALDWFQRRRAHVQRWGQGKHMIKEKQNRALCTYIAKASGKSKAQIELGGNANYITKGFCFGCLHAGVFFVSVVCFCGF